MEYIIKYTGDILSLGYPTELLDAQFAIMELTDQAVGRILEHRQVTCFEPARRLSGLLSRSLEAACIPPVQRENGLGLTGQGVLTGFVDSGLDLTHPEFLGEDGHSRVVALWDMTAEGTPPEGFHRGAVFSGAEIDAGLVSSMDQSGHGTAVAAIAAGRSGAAPGASIAAVKLGSSRTTDVMRAVKFLLDQAEARGMPCVVNISYGTNCGSHWGQTLFESYIDQSAQRGRSVVVCAAGNEGSGAHHFQGQLAEGGIVDAEFNISTRRERVYLSLWKSFSDEAAFELVLPNGRTTGPLTEGTRFLRFGSIRVSVFYGVPTHYSASQEVLMYLDAPAGELNGLWKLRCYGKKVSDGRFNVWLPTMEEVTDRTAFLQPEPNLTITLPATALFPISVGGFRPETETISPFSGRGVQDCAGRSLLDITAPAEGVRSAKAGGGYDVFTGTSMAAPFVSGAAALMMEWGIVQGNDLFLYNQRVKAFLCKGAVRSPYMAYPNPQWGYGRLSLCGAMNELVNHLERGFEMRLTPETLAFIHAPDTVDFITRATDTFFDYAHSSDDIVVGQTLSGRYVLGYVKAENFHRLEEALGAAFVSSVSVVLGLLDRPALEAAGVSQVHNQPYLNLKGRGVLLGFVDTGIDYTQDVFRYEDGSSKIQYIYDQTAEGDPPSGFLLGREYSKADIDAALASDDPHALVPERDESGHGTFLASVAAGKQTDEFTGAAPDAEIIAVKLKKARSFYREKYCVPADQEDAYESSAVMIGVEYILRKAQELGRPVAICIGLGTNAGGHDGYSVFEEYLGGVSIQKGVCLCAAAGNEAEARHHTSGVLQPGGPPGQVDLKVGENAGNIYMAVWNTVADRISLSVRSPSGELVGRVPARPGSDPAADVKLVLEAARVQIEYHFPVEGSGGQLSVIRILGATPGVWTVQLHGDIVLNGQYQMWLPMTGFVAPSVEFLAATPDYTVTSPASAVGLICCGAYDSAGKSLYAKSSRGPAWDSRVLPDLVAPGVGVRGIYPYGPGLMSGTSAAAAVLAGICALLLQWGIREGNDLAMGTYQIRAYLIRGCLRRKDMTYPNNQWGYGAVQLMQSFHLMREL